MSFHLDMKYTYSSMYISYLSGSNFQGYRPICLVINLLKYESISNLYIQSVYN